MTEDEKEDITKVKVILIGDSGVGKTSLINAAGGGSFNPIEPATITASYILKPMKINNKNYNLNIWDTIGQENLRALTKIFFKSSKIVIFVYDITKKYTFESLNGWVNDVKEIIGDDIIKGVIGNKTDLYLNEEVKDEEGEEFANSINAKFKTTSAKCEPKGFSEFLEELLIEYIKENDKNNNNDSIELNKKDVQKKNTKKCC